MVLPGQSNTALGHYLNKLSAIAGLAGLVFAVGCASSQSNTPDGNTPAENSNLTVNTVKVDAADATFGPTATAELPKDVSELFAQCDSYVVEDKGAYIESRWSSCGGLNTPDRYVHLKFQEGSVSLADAMPLMMLKPAPKVDPDTMEVLEEGRDMAGEKVEFLRMTVSESKGADRALYGVKTADNHYLMCVVRVTRGTKKRNAAHAKCPVALDGMLRAIR